MMSDRVRQLVTMAITMGMIIAVISAPTLAQVTGSAIENAAASGNADKVDGRHAVGSGASKTKRSGKVVGGGFGQEFWELTITDPHPHGTNAWIVYAENDGGVSRSVSATAMCMTTTPGAALASKGGVRISRKK